MHPLIRVLASFCLVCLIAGSGASRAADDSSLSSYRLGSGDLISITVFGEEDLSPQKIRVSDKGTITYPVLGELKLSGLPIKELESMITNGLKGRWLVNPKVSVTVLEYRQFYVNGFVEKPGGYPYVPGLNVRKAVSIAGGFKERAAKDKIFLIEEGDTTHRPKKVGLDVPVNAGDIITVEESFF